MVVLRRVGHSPLDRLPGYLGESWFSVKGSRSWPPTTIASYGSRSTRRNATKSRSYTSSESPLNSRNIAYRSGTRLCTQRSQARRFSVKTSALSSNLDQVLQSSDPIVVRDACSCPSCVNPSTRQKQFLTSQIPTNVRIKSINYPQPDQARITWENDIDGWSDSHISEYRPSDLLWTFPSNRSETSVSSNREFWDKSTFSADKSNWIEYSDFMNSSDSLKRTLSNLSRYGLVFITDIPSTPSGSVPSPTEISAVSDLATRIGPLYNSHYGLTWDVRSIPSAKNVAYTNVDLGFHMDLLYKQSPPYIQLLHCLRNSQSGGESLFVDAFRAARELWNSGDEGKHHFKVLRDNEVGYHYLNDGQYFQNTHRTIECNASAEGLHPDSPPEISQMYYSPPFQSPFPTTTTTQFGSMPEVVKALAAFEKQLSREDLIYELKMEPGTCVIFENLRVCHARRSFTVPKAGGGERWLRGAYVGKDDYLSRLWGVGVSSPATS